MSVRPCWAASDAAKVTTEHALIAFGTFLVTLAGMVTLGRAV
jgi:hypothetical protein